jgi:hypothetical protein
MAEISDLQQQQHPLLIVLGGNSGNDTSKQLNNRDYFTELKVNFFYIASYEQ